MTLEEENQVRELINSGNRFLAARRYQEAIDAYNKALEVDPENHIAKGNIALVHNNWGTEFFNQRKYLDAKHHWQTAVDLNPNDSIARRNLRVLEVHIRNDRLRAKQEELRRERQMEKEAEAKEKEDEIEKAKLDLSLKQEAEKKTKKPPQSAVLILNSGGTKYSSNTNSSNSSQITEQADSKGDSQKVEKPSNSNIVEEKKQPDSQDTSNIKIINSSPKEDTSVDTILQDSLKTLKNSYEDKSKEDTTNNTKPTNFKTVVEKPVNQEVENKQKIEEEKPVVKEEPELKKEKKSASLTIKEQIRKLELTVFGEKRESMPIIKRLEQLEKDTLGKKQSGPINNRVKRLNETYGL